MAPDRTIAEMSSETHNVYWDKGAMVLITLGSAIFVAVCAGWLFFGWPDNNGRMLIASLLGIPFFGWIGVLSFFRIFLDDGPAITISPEGVRDRNISRDLLGWEHVESIGERGRFMNRSITFIMPNRPSLPMNLRQRVYQLLNSSHEYITSAGFTTESHARLLKLLRAYLEEWKSKRESVA